MSELRIGSLCTGYGGLDHAVQNVFGGDVAWVSDIDKGACKIIAHRYPYVPNIGDMTKVDWAELSPVDILTAGYPCQPFSHAGRRKGTNDERHLWPYVREAVRVLRPRITVLENVAGHRSLGFDRVLGDLAEDGMHVWWTSLRASDVGAAHQRERLFILVTPDAERPRWGTPRDTAPSEAAGRRTPTVTGRPGGAPADLTLLPTPAVNDMGASYTPETWDAWTEKMRAEHANGNGHGKSLSIEAQRLLPTPTSSDSAASGGSSPSDVTLTDAVVRTEFGTTSNVRHAALLPTPSAADGLGGHERRGGDRGSELLLNGQAKAMAGSQWGIYAPAIARWEAVTGRRAPEPTKLSIKGNPKLSPAFVEWLMGLSPGFVTDVPDITDNECLKALGNGVVWQQAAAATRLLLNNLEVAA